MSEKATGRESDKFMLRLPDGMRDELKRAAAENGRSMNAEVVARLEASFREPSRIAETDVRYIVDQIVAGLVHAGWKPPTPGK